MPPDYESTVAVPLVVVYSPAGVTDPAQTESFKGLTDEAADAGYAIAYVNHVSPIDGDELAEGAEVPALIADKWCIDESRIYLTGHSNGGSVSTLLTMDGITPTPGAIAPSAAGVSRSGYLDYFACVDPISVMVLHSSNDSLFPVDEGFGADAAAWWAECAGCDETPGDEDADGCIAYTGCTDGVEVQYCEGTGSHGTWPSAWNEAMFDFFDRFESP